MAVRANRDEFIEQGFVILRQVIPPGQLEGLRRAHELLVDRQRTVWARNRGPDDPPGGEWETSDQPRLAIHDMGAEHDQETAGTIEVWLHENFQGVSSLLLAEEDVPPTAMALICNPARDHGPGPWHRDFYPPLTAPLQCNVNRAGFFRGCRHSLMFRRPYSLDPRVAPTVVPSGTRRLGLIHHAELGLLPSQAVASQVDRTGQLSTRDLHPLWIAALSAAPTSAAVGASYTWASRERVPHRLGPHRQRRG